MASIDQDPNLWVYEARARLYDQTRGMTSREIGDLIRAKSAEVIRKYGNGRTADELIAENHPKVVAYMREREAEREASERAWQEREDQIVARFYSETTDAVVTS